MITFLRDKNLLCDFNVNLLNYNNHNLTNDFLDFLASNSFVPYILQLTRLTSHSKTLIENIFSDIISPEVISGKLPSITSDHLSQFMVVPKNVSVNFIKTRLILLKEIGLMLTKKTLFLITFLLNSMQHLQNVDYSTESFLNKINSLLSNYAPL